MSSLDATTTSSSSGGTTVYKELVEFLESSRVDVRVAALDAVLGVKDREGLMGLVKEGVVGALARGCGHPDPVGVRALHALVYLTSHGGPQEAQCIQDLLDANGVGRMTEVALDKPNDDGAWKKRVNWALALLVNLTRTERGAVELIGRSFPEEAVPTSQLSNDDADAATPTKPQLELLLNRFLSTDYIDTESFDAKANDYDEYEAHEWDSQSEDPYQHMAAVLMNSTQTEQGRRWVMKILRTGPNDAASTSVLQKLLPQLRSSNPVRRRGVAGTVKNCCLDTGAAWWLLNQVCLTKHVLYPLAGPEELDVEDKRGMDPDLWLEGPDKVREPDPHTRLLLVESILLLCASGRQSRQSLRLSRVYVILKWADMVEEEENVSERINECVQFLRRDEEGTAEGSSDETVRLALESSAALQIQANNKEDEDYDGVD